MPPIIWVAQAEVLHHNPLVRALGASAYVTDLDPGDYAFGAEGIKPDKQAGSVGIEYKMHEDLANCIIYSARHLDQLRRMRSTYDEVILMIGVRVVPSEEGLACIRARRRVAGGGYETAYIPITPRQSPNATITFTRYLKHLYTIERLMGVRIMEVDSVQIAALKILALADWWQTEPEKHSSWLAEYRPQALMPGGRPHLVRRLAAELKGIGVEKSLNVYRKALEMKVSARDVMNWDVQEWMEVEGIGTGIAEGIRREMEEVVT